MKHLSILLFSLIVFSFFKCKKEEQIISLIPKEILIKNIFVSDVPEKNWDDEPWDIGSTADIMLIVGRFYGGEAPVFLSNVIFDINHLEKTELPLDSIITISDVETSFTWEVSHWDQDDPFGPDNVPIGSSQFRFPFTKDSIHETFIHETIAGLGFKVKVDFEIQYIY